MKKYSFINLILILGLIFSFQSCNDQTDSEFPEAVNPENLPWQATTHMKFRPVEDKEAFVWVTNLLTYEQYWGNDTVELNVQLKSVVPTADFSKIDFYVTAMEKDGYNSMPPYDTEGKFLTSITDLPESGEFELKIDADTMYNMFKDKYENPRNEAPLLEGDIFELHWIITNTDGTILNSTDFVDGEYRFGLGVIYEDFAPPVWAGEFNYEWIEVGSGATWDVNVGDTGTIKITETGPGTYHVSNLLFNFYYGEEGTLTYDFLSGLTEVHGDQDEEWFISNVNGDTLEISWWYKYSADYDEYGTVRLTRTDGNNWPENIHTPN